MSKVVIFVGGALTILGFWLPPAAVVGGAMVSLATAYQLPQIVMHPLSEVLGGYRNFSISDLANAAGLLSTLAGLPGAAEPKATAKLSMRATSAAEKSIALRLTGKAASQVLKFSNFVSDYWGMWLGSAAAVNGVAKIVDGKCKDTEELMLTILDILNGGLPLSLGLLAESMRSTNGPAWQRQRPLAVPSLQAGRPDHPTLQVLEATRVRPVERPDHPAPVVGPVVASKKAVAVPDHPRSQSRPLEPRERNTMPPRSRK